MSQCPQERFSPNAKTFPPNIARIMDKYEPADDFGALMKRRRADVPRDTTHSLKLPTPTAVLSDEFVQTEGYANAHEEHSY
jgi:hypothetical protein